MAARYPTLRKTSTSAFQHSFEGCAKTDAERCVTQVGGIAEFSRCSLPKNRASCSFLSLTGLFPASRASLPPTQPGYFRTQAARRRGKSWSVSSASLLASKPALGSMQAVLLLQLSNPTDTGEGEE